MRIRRGQWAAAALAALSLAQMSEPALAAGHQVEADNLDRVVQVSLLPARLGGVACGVAIGTPVAVVRESYKSYLDLTGAGAEQIHGRDCAPVCLLVSVFTLPTGLVLGTCKGTYYGVKNGVTRGFATPFNAQSFSLGNLDDAQ